MKYDIPFNRPFVAGNEQKYIAEAIRRGQISGNGHFTRQCEKLLEALLDSPRVILTTSCTDALEMAALLLELGPEDEVVIPSFGFVSTAKEAMVKIIAQLPDDSSYEEILRELAFARMVQRGLNDSDEGRVVEDDEVRRKIESWQK